MIRDRVALQNRASQIQSAKPRPRLQVAAKEAPEESKGAHPRPRFSAAAKPSLEEQKAEAIVGDDEFEVSFKYGNRHRLVKHPKSDTSGKMHNHEFTAFVQLQTKTRVKTNDILEKVVFRLPRSLYGDNSVLEIAGDKQCGKPSSAFECTRTTWKAVNVSIELQFRQEGERAVENVKLTH